MTDGAGNLTDSYSYSAFGESYARTGSTANPYLFTGQQYDTATGLYSMRAWYYDPSVGRFLTRDTFPINYGNPIELNRYGYVANNPIRHTDPSGYGLFSYAVKVADTLRPRNAFGAAIGYVTGRAVGGISAYFMYQLARSGECGIPMRNWAYQTDLGEFIRISADIGGATGVYIGSLSPHVAMTISVMTGGGYRWHGYQ